MAEVASIHVFYLYLQAENTYSKINDNKGRIPIKKEETVKHRAEPFPHLTVLNKKKKFKLRFIVAILCLCKI